MRSVAATRHIDGGAATAFANAVTCRAELHGIRRRWGRREVGGVASADASGADECDTERAKRVASLRGGDLHVVLAC